MWLSLAVLFGAAAPALAQPADVEGAIKATFLYRFASFTQWPAASFATPSDPVVICVSGDPAFAALVGEAARGERVAGRGFVVRAIDAVTPSSACHILYAARARGQTAAQALEAVRGRPVLTVTDQLHGSARGMVHFVVSQGRVRFHVDDAAAAASGLAFNSRLLSVALSVRQRTRARAS